MYCECADIPHLPLPSDDNNGGVISPRIVGGTQALLGEFPGSVSIQNRQGFHFCGGTMIHTSHIVTAAHCVTDKVGKVTQPNQVR